MAFKSRKSHQNFEYKGKTLDARFLQRFSNKNLFLQKRKYSITIEEFFATYSRFKAVGKTMFIRTMSP